VATGTCGSDTASRTITVNPVPVAGFAWQALSLTVTFTNTSQHASAFLWEFGDGLTSTLASPTHTYPMTGTYDVTLQATGPCGEDRHTSTIWIGVPQPLRYIYLPLVVKQHTP